MYGHHQLPKNCWLKIAGEEQEDEETWVISHEHVAINSKTPIKLTAGNKKYALSSVAEPSGADSNTKYPSEMSLYKKYS